MRGPIDEAWHGGSAGPHHYDPNQPRVPKGHPGGGQWTSGSGSALAQSLAYGRSRADRLGVTRIASPADPQDKCKMSIGFLEPAQIIGNSGPPDSTEIALAEPICRTAHRDAPPGMPGSCADPWRMAFASGPEIVLSLLQRDAHASGIGQGHSPPPPSAASRYHCQRSNLIGTTAMLGHNFRKTHLSRKYK